MAQRIAVFLAEPPKLALFFRSSFGARTAFATAMQIKLRVRQWVIRSTDFRFSAENATPLREPGES